MWGYPWLASRPSKRVELGNEADRRARENRKLEDEADWQRRQQQRLACKLDVPAPDNEAVCAYCGQPLSEHGSAQ